MIGVGASPYDSREAGVQVVGVNVASAATRGQHWRAALLQPALAAVVALRDMLDLANNTGIMLPPHPRLKTDLCAPLWSPSGSVVEGREPRGHHQTHRPQPGLRHGLRAGGDGHAHDSALLAAMGVAGVSRLAPRYSTAIPYA